MSDRKKQGLKKTAVFLDRDGTLNEEVGYLSRLDQLRVFPEAAQAVRLINRSGMLAVVITNQSGVARGHFDEALVESVHARINEILAESDARIDRFYYCPHHPAEGNSPYVKVCSCRKPEPGLLRLAAEELDINLARSYMIGDTPKDIEAANRAGARGVLVRTGYGREIERADGTAYIAENILEAVTWILKDRVS